MPANDTVNDTTTTLSRGAQDGDTMDESLVTQRDGATLAKRPRVVVGDDEGNLFGDDNPMPVDDSYARRACELECVRRMNGLDLAVNARHRERFSVGDRGSLYSRGPGGR